MAQFYADENFRYPVVAALRGLGHDVLTCSDVGMTNRRVPDGIVLEFATRLGRAVLTVNRNDFVALHDRGAAHAGIIACEENLDFEALARHIDRVLADEAYIVGRVIEVTK